MPPGDSREAERLNAAIDALLRGDAVDAPDVSEGLDGLLDPARILASAGRGRNGGPRPSFVLGLEEQLRTDLRVLRRPEGVDSSAGDAPSAEYVHVMESANVTPSSARADVAEDPTGAPGPASQVSTVGPRSWKAISVVMGAVVVLVILLAAQRAIPSDLLYPVKKAQESIELALAPGDAAESRVYFRLGRRRLVEAATIVREQRSASFLYPVLGEMVVMYSRGAAAATRSGDTMAVLNAQVEVRAAEVELARVSDQAPPEQRGSIDESRADLLRVIEPIVDSPAPEPTEVTEASRSTAQPSPGPSDRSTATSVPATTMPEPTDRPTEGAATLPSVTPAPSATHTPSPTPTETTPRPTEADPEPTEPPIATVTPLKPDRPPPTPTSEDLTATPTAQIGPVIPTRDAWPTETPSNPTTPDPPPEASATPGMSTRMPDPGTESPSRAGTSTPAPTNASPDRAQR